MGKFLSYEGIWKDDGSRIFRTSKNEVFYAEKFEDGNLLIDASLGTTIQHIAKLVVECFSKESNTNEVISAAFEKEENVQSITFEFNDVMITARADTSAQNIVQQLYAGYKVQEEKREAEYEEYKKTPQYAIDMAEAKRKEEESEKLKAEVIKIDKTTEVKFKNEEGQSKWNEFVEINSKDGYSAAVVEYARLWAKYMQNKIANGEKLIDIAESASHAADISGITGFMYGCAVNVLVQVWIYGEELRKWHNKEYNYNGVGVVNPVVITINY